MDKRLTYRDESGKAWACLNNESTREEQMDFGRLSLKRLAAYEDLGSVEELAEMKQEINIIKNTEPIELGMAKLKLGLLQQQIADGKLVEVVRCGECKKFETDECALAGSCDGCDLEYDNGFDETGYCAKGERREK